MIWVSIFIANAAVLILEIVGARALTPFFGSSAEVWAGFIGVVLLGLAVGYWGGGVIADRLTTNRDRERSLAATLAAAGVTITALWLGSDATAAVASQLIPYLGLTLAASAAALIHFFIPSMCLAAASPIAARILLHSLDTSARTVGRISAVGAAGSVLGSIGVAAALVPYAAASTIIMSTGVCLLLLGLFLGVRAGVTTLILLCMVASAIGGVGTYSITPRAADMVRGTLVADVPSRYGRIFVIDEPYDTKTSLRVVRTDPLGTQCGQYIRVGAHLPELPFAYTRAFDVLYSYVPEPKRVAVVGGCNYSYPVHLATRTSHAHIDVVELDPAMTEVARKWFAFTEPEYLTATHADGRQYFETEEKTYDVIVLDAFGSLLAPPFQLLTTEAFKSMKDDLAPDGVVVMNLISSVDGPGAEYTASVYHTLASVFPSVVAYRIVGNTDENIQNLIFVASPILRQTLASVRILPHHELLTEIDSALFWNTGMVFTDDYAPVERLTIPMRASVLYGRS